MPRSKPETAPPERLRDVPALCREFDRSERTVRRMVADGEIGYVRVRGRLMFSDSDVREYIERNRTPAVVS
jgi:excisionase family DNA binding protein